MPARPTGIWLVSFAIHLVRDVGVISVAIKPGVDCVDGDSDSVSVLAGPRQLVGGFLGQRLGRPSQLCRLEIRALRLTKTLAKEAAYQLARAGKDRDGIGITVNTVTPGLIATEMTANILTR